MLRRTLVAARRGCGIVGLPNVGKSTFFNAMTCSQLAKTGNYPFCTIDANLSKAPIFDPRARDLAKFTGAEKIVDVEIDLADVAGLIEGASKGAGMGNKFLNDVRPCNIVLHMVRCFECAKEGFETPDPLGDIATIDQELIFADIESVERKGSKLRNRKASDPETAFTKKLLAHLNDAKPARTFKAGPAEQEWLTSLQLLSGKPVLFVLNVDEASMAEGNEFSRRVEEKYGQENALRVCSVVEEQTAQFTRDERLDFLSEYGVKNPCADAVLQRVYDMLRMQTFFTVGPKMVHAWAIPKGTTARQAAGEIHGSFERHFTAAKVTPWSEYITAKGYKAADGSMVKVPASYEMRDGDVFIVEHSAGEKL